MEQRKTVAEMSGEFLREVAVLTAVFVPLESIIVEHALTWTRIAFTLVLVAVAFGVGMLIEVHRE